MACFPKWRTYHQLDYACSSQLSGVYCFGPFSVKEGKAGSPPSSPHLGTWEREIKSAKDAPRVVVGSQPVPAAVLQTVLVKVEGIPNSRPLGYISSDVAVLDPVTPDLLLMGRCDASLPQAVYANSQLIGRRGWPRTQILADHFWASFIRYHLPGLQTRSNGPQNRRTKAGRSCDDCRSPTSSLTLACGKNNENLPWSRWPC